MTAKANLIFADLDGTLFDPNIGIIKAPFYNLRTSLLMQKREDVFILTTGRPEWNKRLDNFLLLLGVTKKPDIIIVGAGTHIYRRTKEGRLLLDKKWDALISKNWNKDDIVSTLQLKSSGTDNSYMVRVPVVNKKITDLFKYVDSIKKILKDNARVLVAERLSLHNTEDIFSGYILIAPPKAGKDSSANYVIRSYTTKDKRPEVFLFGDGLIDSDMLLLDTGYALNPTPLARRKLDGKVAIVEGSPPKTLLQTLRGSQNSPFRLILRPIESLLNLFYPTKTPNELSLLGLSKVKKAVKLGYEKNLLRKVLALDYYLTGISLDLLDGVRARKKPALKEENGQLVDGYADRMKEVIPLVYRSETRLKREPEQAVNTYLTAISCILPSISRAQAEAIGKTVPEYDTGGGSSFGRALLLIRSFFLDIFGMSTRSYTIDKKIGKLNITTYQNRMKMVSGFEWNNQKYDSIAMERLLVYTEILQKTYSGVLNTLAPYSSCQKNFTQKTMEIAKKYLDVNIDNVRKMYRFKKFTLPDNV